MTEPALPAGCAIATIADNQLHRRHLDRNSHDESALTSHWTSAKPAPVETPAPAPVPPDLIGDRYELFRIITDLEALHEGFRDRVEDLQITRLEADAAGDLQPGYSSKLLCNPPMKSFGRESLPRMLKATGMALVLVIDNEQFAPIKQRLTKRTRPLRSMGRIVRPKWLFTPGNASQISKKRWENVPPEMRKKMMKKLAKAGWIARRRRARQARVIDAT